MKYCEVLHQNYHMQGFTSDGEFMYWSFTDSLVKTTMKGTVKRQVEIPAGHLGDIDYHDGKIYGTVMGNSLAGRPWGLWTSFEVHVFDADTLALIRIIRLDECYDMYAEKREGFNGVDGVTVHTDDDGKPVMTVASALFNGEDYVNQMLLECDMNGKIKEIHRIRTGNTTFGIQNLDRDPETGCWWFSTYGGKYDYQNRAGLLFCVDPNFENILGEYEFSTPYGLHCLGGGRYYASFQSGINGNRDGYAYEVDEEYFNTVLPEAEANAANLKPLFDETIGL